MLEIKIELPQKISGNKLYAGVHWTTRAKIAEDFHLAVWASVKNAKVKPIDPKLYPVDMEYTFFLKGKLDTSNTFAMLKLVEDGLVGAKILSGDSQEFVGKITTSIVKTEENIPKVIIKVIPK